VSFTGLELVTGQSPARKNVSMEAGEIVVTRNQAKTGENTADWEDLVHTVVNCNV
jgi:hypothetical protein